MFDDVDGEGEAFARELVAIMRAFDRRLGHGMPVQSLLTKFGWERLADGKAGLAFALERKWLADGPGSFVVLTEEAPRD